MLTKMTQSNYNTEASLLSTSGESDPPFLANGQGHTCSMAVMYGEVLEPSPNTLTVKSKKTNVQTLTGQKGEWRKKRKDNTKTHK